MNKPPIAVPLIFNGLVGAIIGAAFGYHGGMIAWTIGSFCVGVLLAAIWEALFHPMVQHPRQFRFRPVLLVLLELLYDFQLNPFSRNRRPCLQNIS